MLVIDRNVHKAVRTIPVPPHLEVMRMRIESALSQTVKIWVAQQARLAVEGHFVLTWEQSRLREEIRRRFSARAHALKLKVSAIENSLLFAWLSYVLQELDSCGDDSQLANVDLQNVLQKQQQVLQMLSIISKLIHDTDMAVIRKIGG